MAEGRREAQPLAVCVFCGSRAGGSPAFAEAAAALGEGLARLGMTLVYGGGDVGLMAVVANAATAAGGTVVGFIPQRLMEREVGKRGITDLVVTETMFERKARMIAGSDAFVTLPGGLGTLDELLEVVTLRQLGYHDKPVLLVDTEGYWKPFLAMYADVVAKGFASPSALALMEAVPDVARALGRLTALAPNGKASSPLRPGPG